MRCIPDDPNGLTYEYDIEGPKTPLPCSLCNLGAHTDIIADVLCKRSHVGSGGDDKIPTVHPLAMEHLQLNEDDLNTIIEELQEDEEKVKAFLGAIQ